MEMFAYSFYQKNANNTNKPYKELKFVTNYIK